MTLAARLSRKAAPLEPADVRCDIKISRPLPGADDDVHWTELPLGFAEVTVEVTMTVYDDDSDDEEVVPVARASAYTIGIDTYGNTDRAFGYIVEGLDRVGGEAFHLAETALTRYGDDILSEIGGPDGMELTTQLVFVEEVWVEEPYRGQGIARRVLAALIDGADGTGQQSLVMLRAWSPHWNAVSEIEIRRLQKKLVPKLEHIGFRPFREGLYWRHTALSTPEGRGEPLSS